MSQNETVVQKCATIQGILSLTKEEIDIAWQMINDGTLVLDDDLFDLFQNVYSISLLGENLTHDIFEDRAGFGNHPRLTCLSCNKTLVKQPYMTLTEWESLKFEFRTIHK